MIFGLAAFFDFRLLFCELTEDLSSIGIGMESNTTVLDCFDKFFRRVLGDGSSLLGWLGWSRRRPLPEALLALGLAKLVVSDLIWSLTLKSSLVETGIGSLFFGDVSLSTTFAPFYEFLE